MPDLFDNQFKEQEPTLRAGPTSNAESLIRSLLARSGGAGAGLGTPVSGMPFSGMPTFSKAPILSTDFAQPQRSAPPPETPFLPPPSPQFENRPLKVGAAMGEGMFDKPFQQGPTKSPGPNDDELKRIRDALAASQNALADLYKNPSPAAGQTQGAAPNAGTFARPRKRVYTPDQAPEGVPGGVEEVADMAGIPAGYFDRLRGQESGTDDSAVNKASGASGRYQFLPSTVASLIKQVPGLRDKINENWKTDPNQQDELLRAYTQISLDTLKPILKDRMPTMGELYALHFFGHSGGANALRNADTKLGSLFPDIVFEQNPTLSRDMTPAQFVQYINNAWK